MVLLEFAMFPIAKGESLSPYVARIVDIIDRSGLPYQCGAMGTTIEGEWDQVMTVLRECFIAMRTDCDRIATTVKIDYRGNASGRLRSKVESVASKVGRPLSC